MYINKTNCTYVAAAHLGGTITVWDYNKRVLVRELNEHMDEVR